jgi:hypothetical protein
MSHLIAEIALRLAKALAAAILGAILYLVASTVLGGTPGIELALLAWIAAAALILLVESSPI